MNASEKLHRYAAAALAYEDAQAAAREAQEMVEQAGRDALPLDVNLPVSVSMPDGRVVTIDDWNEPDNYCLTYTISEGL